MTINQLLEFFGWCSVINLALLLISFCLLTLFKKTISNLHYQLFGIDPAKLDTLYFNWLAYYKMAIILFNVVPYIALTLMT